VGALGDGWRYKPYVGNGTLEFLGGNTVTGVVPSYVVTRGTLHPSNNPGTRVSATAWFRQGKGECWFFGGDNTQSTLSIVHDRSGADRFALT
jgi:hypothetical protein